MKPAESAQVEFIKALLRKGEERKNILPKFAKTYKTSLKTFDNRLKLATKALQDEAGKINKQVEQSVTKEIESRILRILTVAERIDILAKMATGDIEIKTMVPKWDPNQLKYVVVPIIVLPNHSDRRGAIAELNKMGGDYAPERMEVTEGKKFIVKRKPPIGSN